MCMDGYVCVSAYWTLFFCYCFIRGLCSLWKNEKIYLPHLPIPPHPEGNISIGCLCVWWHHCLFFLRFVFTATEQIQTDAPLCKKQWDGSNLFQSIQKIQNALMLICITYYTKFPYLLACTHIAYCQLFSFSLLCNQQLARQNIQENFQRLLSSSFALCLCVECMDGEVMDFGLFNCVNGCASIAVFLLVLLATIDMTHIMLWVRAKLDVMFIVSKFGKQV